MKLIKAEVSIIPQESGVIGLKKHLEKIGRIAYKSEDRITDDSYKKFLNMIYNRGHWAVFDSGTVYLKYPISNYSSSDSNIISDSLNIIKIKSSVYTRVNKVLPWEYITTNYRVIKQLGIDDSLLSKYWSDPEDEHELRITTKWICSRDIAQELTRHRCMSFMMESQRYINYSKEKFGKEITYILPRFIYRVRDDVGNTIDSATGFSRNYILSLDGEELWKELCTIDRTVASRDKIWKEIEDEYIYETTTDEGEHLKAEEARGCLCNDTKTELCMTGWLSDYIMEECIDSPEKKGFFNLRCSSDAKEDIRYLANDLKGQFIKKGLLK